MNYSKLTWSIDSKIVGVRDGVGPCYLDEDFYNRHPWYAQIFMPSIPKPDDNNWWLPRANMPEYGGSLLQIPMEKRAKHTDFIDFGGFQHGYLVNSRLRELLERARLPKHRYFPVSFKQGDNEVEGYWWLCYDLETGKENVDFKNSNFLISTNGRLWNEEVSIASYANYLQIIEETGQAAHASKLQFKPSFDQSLDIWGVQFLSSVKGYISNRLAQIFYQEKITGFELNKLKCVLFFE